MVPLIALACWVMASLLRRTELSSARASIIGAVAVALLAASPVNRQALLAGHPEEILTGALTVAAVLMARSGRANWAGLLLGLAIGSKAWGVIAAAPVLLALPGSRRHVALIAGAVVAVSALAPVLADLSAFRHALHYEGVQHLVNPLSFWWPVSSPLHFPGIVTRKMPLGLSRTTASAITMAVVLPGFALLWRAAHRRGFNVEPLALLALLGVLRTVCDSTHLEYYYEAALIPLVVWETCGARRLPVLSACAMAAVAASFGVGSTLAPALLNVLSIGLSCALATHLARRSFFASPVRQAVKAEQRPGLGRILGSRLRAVHPLSS
jgi:hypothetical protein